MANSRLATVQVAQANEGRLEKEWTNRLLFRHYLDSLLAG